MFASSDIAELRPNQDLREDTPAPTGRKGGRPRAHDYDWRISYAIARELQNVRWLANLTQDAIAKRIGLSRGRVSTIESGKRTVTWSTCARWASACGRSVVDVAVAVERAVQEPKP